MNYQELTIIGSLFTLGFFGGFSHCIGMCGPFVLNQVGNRLGNIKIQDASILNKLSGLALLPYHFGRITTYCFLGGLSNILSSNIKNISNFKTFSGILLIIAVILIFNVTIYKIKLPKRLLLSSFTKRFINFLPFSFVTNKISFLFANPTVFKTYFLGILLGFIPCGLVYGAIVVVSSMDNFRLAAFAMVIFGIATIPSLFASACGGWLFFDKIRNNFKINLKILVKIILMVNISTLFIMAVGLISNKI